MGGAGDPSWIHRRHWFGWRPLSVAAILAFLAGMKNWPWKLIGCIALGVVVIGGLYFFGKSAYDAGVSNERAYWEHRIARAQAHINNSTTHEADTTERVNVVTRTIVQQAQREVTDAAQRQDVHAMYVAWSNGISRVWDDRASPA